MTHYELGDGNERERELELPPPLAEMRAAYPARDAVAWNALAARIVASAAPELARRRGDRGIMRSMLRWSRPLAVAAAAIFFVGAAALTFTSDADASPASAVGAPTFAEVVDREPASALMSTDRPPSANDLARALEGDTTAQAQR